MTWIVGMPTCWGYSIGISDIRVTLQDGSEYDCLQKIHPIAQSIALGFAGSVRIGFRMVETMKQWLHCDHPQVAWHPIEVLAQWPEIARGVFATADAEEQELASHLIVLSADPQSTMGDAPWARTYVHILRSPDFEPEQIVTNKVAGIGCGNFIDAYRKSLDELSENYDANFNLMKGEHGNPGGMGTMLGFNITQLIKETNPSGISSHLHYCWVYLGQTIIRTNNHFTAGRWTGFDSDSGISRSEEAKPSENDASNTLLNKVIPGYTYFVMPKIAHTSDELEQMLEAGGAKAEGAVA